MSKKKAPPPPVVPAPPIPQALPDLCVLNILGHLSTEDLVHMAGSVCHYWAEELVPVAVRRHRELLLCVTGKADSGSIYHFLVQSVAEAINGGLWKHQIKPLENSTTTTTTTYPLSSYPSNPNEYYRMLRNRALVIEDRTMLSDNPKLSTNLMFGLTHLHLYGDNSIDPECARTMASLLLKTMTASPQEDSEMDNNLNQNQNNPNRNNNDNKIPELRLLSLKLNLIQGGSRAKEDMIELVRVLNRLLTTANRSRSHQFALVLSWFLDSDLYEHLPLLALNHNHQDQNDDLTKTTTETTTRKPNNNNIRLALANNYLSTELLQWVVRSLENTSNTDSKTTPKATIALTRPQTNWNAELDRLVPRLDHLYPRMPWNQLHFPSLTALKLDGDNIPAEEYKLGRLVLALSRCTPHLRLLHLCGGGGGGGGCQRSSEQEQDVPHEVRAHVMHRYNQLLRRLNNNINNAQEPERQLQRIPHMRYRDARYILDIYEESPEETGAVLASLVELTIDRFPVVSGHGQPSLRRVVGHFPRLRLFRVERHAARCSDCFGGGDSIAAASTSNSEENPRKQKQKQENSNSDQNFNKEEDIIGVGGDWRCEALLPQLTVRSIDGHNHDPTKKGSSLFLGVKDDSFPICL